VIIESVLRRASNDLDFRMKVLANPSQALRSYPLPEERRPLLERGIKFALQLSTQTVFGRAIFRAALRENPSHFQTKTLEDLGVRAELCDRATEIGSTARNLLRNPKVVGWVIGLGEELARRLDTASSEQKADIDDALAKVKSFVDQD
jgi:hypothetical protein